jgi:hypothetical protein
MLYPSRIGRMTRFIWELNVKTTDETNAYEKPFVKTKRHKQQQFFVRSLLGVNLPKIVQFPCLIRFTRLASRKMDEEDNLRMAFKWIKDEVGSCLFPERAVIYVTKKGKVRENKGHADSDKRVTWAYAQEPRRIMGIRIEIIYGLSIDLALLPQIERLAQETYSQVHHAGQTSPS